MKIIDLTHIISEDMPVYPGTNPPVLESANTYIKDGFKDYILLDNFSEEVDRIINKY